jgi:SAM-dependent methyltransferase
MKEFNTTQLNPETTFEKHVFHRDQFAHFLRWSHVLKIATIGNKILDFGCGSGNLYEVFYRNRYSPTRYLGLDIRSQTIEKNKLKFPKAEFEQQDLTGDFDYGNDWDIIASFETIEHVGKQNVPKFLDNIKKHCNPNTIVLISTPCYNGTAADNHTYDSGDGRGVAHQELTYNELKTLLDERFEIIENFGTFASQKDYKPFMSLCQIEMFDFLTKYYDSNLVSVMMAPFFPEYSRNVLWKVRLKK